MAREGSSGIRTDPTTKGPEDPRDSQDTFHCPLPTNSEDERISSCAVDASNGAVVDDKVSWNILKSAFQDSEMTRLIGLLRKLTSIWIADCKSLEKYVNGIMSTIQKLAEVGFNVDYTLHYKRREPR